MNVKGFDKSLLMLLLTLCCILMVDVGKAENFVFVSSSGDDAHSEKPKLAIQLGHIGLLSGGYFSNDGKRIITSSYGNGDGELGSTIVWDRASGRILGYFHDTYAVEDEVVSKSFDIQGYSHLSKDLEKVDSTTFNRPGLDTRYHVNWNEASRRFEIKSLDHPRNIGVIVTKSRYGHRPHIVGSVLYLDDSCYQQDRNVRLALIGNRRLGNDDFGIYEYEGDTDIYKVCPPGVSEDISSDSSALIGINLNTGKVVVHVYLNMSGVYQITPVYADQLLISGEYLILLDINSGRITHIEGPFNRTYDISVTTDGLYALLAYDRTKVPVFWDLKTGERRNLKRVVRDTHVLRFCPSGKIAMRVTGKVVRYEGDLEETGIQDLLESGPERVVLFDPEKPNRIQVVFEGEGNVLAISPDCKTFFGSKGAGIHGFFSVKTGELLKELLVNNTSEYIKAEFSGDGSVLALWNVFDPDVQEVFFYQIDARTQNVIKRWKTGTLDSVALSFDGRYLQLCSSWSNRSHFLNLVMPDQEKTKLTHNKESSCVHAAVSVQGHYLAYGGSSNIVAVASLMDLHSNKLISEWNYIGSTVLFSRNGNRFYSESTRGIDIRNGQTGQLLTVLKNEEGAVMSMVLSNDENLLLTTHENGVLVFWDVRSEDKRVLARMVHGEESWVVIAPDGRFDSNDLTSMPQVHWLMPDDPLMPLAPETFMRDYYEPQLLKRILDCTRAEWQAPNSGACDKEFPILPSIADLNRAQPIVNIQTIVQDLTRPGFVTVSVKVSESMRTIGTGEQSKKWKSQVCDLRLFRDGQIVGSNPGTRSANTISGRKSAPGDSRLQHWRRDNCIDLDADGTKTLTFGNIRLPQLKEINQVNFSAYAFNEDRVKSKTTVRSYELPKKRELPQRRAYVIAIGVELYEDSRWNLNFPGDDARNIRSVLEGRLFEAGEFQKDQIIALELISERDFDGSGTRVEATKANIETIFRRLAGKLVDEIHRNQLITAIGKAAYENLQPARPDDLVLISYSSHGYADTAGNFYLFPYDIGQSTGGDIATLLPRTISSDELSYWLREVDAGEMVLIIDACHSAAGVDQPGFKPGPMGARGLGQLAYDKGMRILAATRKDSVALETAELGFGLLTAALVKDGLVEGKADFDKPNDKLIMLGEWLRYGVERVPVLYRESRQVGDLSRDAWVIPPENTQLETRDIQQPALFDFRRRKTDLSLGKVSGG